MAPKRKTLDPKLDVVFTRLFGSEQNRPLLIALLSEVLGPSEPVASVEFQAQLELPDDIHGKVVVFDLRVRLGSGELIVVEMQLRRHPALRERILYYWAKLYAGQLKSGEQYSELRRTAVILITDFAEGPGHEFHSVEARRPLQRPRRAASARAAEVAERRAGRRRAKPGRLV